VKSRLSHTNAQPFTGMRLALSSNVRDEIEKELTRCRRLGLIVDEDFERGVTRFASAVRTALLAAAIATIGGMTALTVSHRTLATATPKPRPPSDRTRIERPTFRRTIRAMARRANV